MAADDPDRARRRRLAARIRRQALSRCGELMVGKPVRPCEPSYQLGGGHTARPPRARDAGRVHPRAGGAAGRTAGRDRPAGPQPLLLRRQRLERDRSGAQDELPLLAQHRAHGQAPVHHALEQLSRRDARRARCRPRGTLPRDLPAAADGRDHGTLAGCLRPRAGAKRIGPCTAHVRRHGGDAGAARGRGLRGDRRTAGAVRGRHAHVRPGCICSCCARPATGTVYT